ncbi:hypothetical protein LTR56_005138 [Elasticomyces elasticus]|nr:hypothetical protein LTR56_005138 [Elasticomyces elasticus]KAK3659594.1 hypothetical protein LTR22_008324 [Elasticomyces elasticus]KAK4921296.1 hypothetical protein LTR49_011299 [Elasticomyces elasticus]KAK5759691.1 hypothetical protein LTS12_010208 [Elasticomyces elasticus]
MLDETRDILAGLRQAWRVASFIACCVLTNDARLPQISRHESFTELEHRSRSPASFKPRFPLLALPLELRQQILSYLLPRTKEQGVDTEPLAHHARQFSAVRKREAKGLVLPNTTSNGNNSSNIVWYRGHTRIFEVCQQLHSECADLVYGTNTFLLFLTYEGLKWRYRWLLPSGQAPMRNYPFLDLMPPHYLRLVKRVIVHIDLVDGYTGMIKYNVSGQGLVHGLRRQVQRLVSALKPAEDEEKRELTRLAIRVSNSAMSATANRKRQSGKIVESSEVEVETVLWPFRQLSGVRDASVTGAVTGEYARELEICLQSKERAQEMALLDVDDAGGLTAPLAGLCVYGNDIE